MMKYVLLMEYVNEVIISVLQDDHGLSAIVFPRSSVDIFGLPVYFQILARPIVDYVKSAPDLPR